MVGFCIYGNSVKMLVIEMGLCRWLRWCWHFIFDILYVSDRNHRYMLWSLYFLLSLSQKIALGIISRMFIIRYFTLLKRISLLPKRHSTHCLVPLEIQICLILLNYLNIYLFYFCLHETFITLNFRITSTRNRVALNVVSFTLHSWLMIFSMQTTCTLF